jgi:flavorubredoxin/NADPH-dependent 2,4-dienoyl-CoA reductase/sulfur reductase-like enzyme/rubredoxin
VKTLKLSEGLIYCGVQDPNLSIFDIVMKTEYGTTYNAYVLKGADKTALIETAKHKFLDEYIASLTSLTDVKAIDYIIVSHTEPDHAGSIEHLLEMNPEIQIVGTSTALGFLKHIVNRDFKGIPVKDGDTLDLGGKTLMFMPLPNLHWPDTMFTYIKEDKALITCDSFGAHYSHPGLLRSTVTDEAGYLSAMKYYFDGIIGPFKRPYMTAALERIKDLDIQMILTGHGPVLDSHIKETIDQYAAWCQPDSPFKTKAVVIPYVSAYGYTKALAEEIAKGVEGAGNIEVRLHDLVTEGSQAALQEILWADGFLLGTPTMVGEALKPIWDLATDLLPPMVKGKFASAFGSYGWSGEGVPHILERLKQLRLNVVDGYRVRFKPDPAQLQEAREFGERFGKLVLGEAVPEKPAEIPAGAPAGKPAAKMVRCTVCGAVFDASLDVCPVCGAGRDKFEPVSEAPAVKPIAPAPVSGKTNCKLCGARVDASLANCPVCGGARANFEPVKAPPKSAPAKKVRCLVCGEVFDASLDVCPVCGAGRDSFVPFEEAATTFSRDTNERFLIIGGGAAGYNAAKAIRERNKTAGIVILSQEDELPYNRPMLTKSLLSDFDCGKIAISPRDWYEQQGITLLTGVAAASVDPEDKQVVTKDGAVLAYDKLIYAAGANCFRPPIPGMEFDNVISIRSAKDAARIIQLLPKVKQAVVIGGGVLGIEAAWELCRAGVSVTVVETMPRIMSRQLDEGAAKTLSMKMEEKGMQLRTGAGVCAIEGEEAAERVVLKSGEVLKADLVIVSTGVVPNADLLAAAGAKKGRAVIVDRHMRTNLQDIYACGDCAECDGVNFALWAQAVEEGYVAGANAAGEGIGYRGIPGALTLNALDTTLYAVGEHGTSAAYRAEEKRDDAKGFYEKLFFSGERLAGFILIGDLSRLTELNKAFESRAGL